MKILFVQDHLKSGGAARAAGRWVHLLRKQGHEVRQAAGDEPSAAGLLLTGKPPRGWPRILEWFGEAAVGRRTMVRKKFDEVLSQEKPDLVWFHNLAGGAKWGWSEEMVTLARGHAPVLWTLHDMWALGDGSESYWEEDSVVEGGRGQGAERSGPKVQKCEGEKVGSGEKSRVRKVFGGNGKYPVVLTAPSRWLAELAREITGKDCAFLPNPIDLENFSPGDQKAARRKLGLPEEGLVVLAGADSLADPRKGFDLLREAWGRLPSNRAILALFGRHGENRPGEHYLGNLSSDEEMVAAYQAADLYVHPARLENAACTIQESLACGTPVLAFAVGGIPELIRPGQSGFLAKDLNPTELSRALNLAMNDPSGLKKIRTGCRSLAERIWKDESITEIWDSFRENRDSGKIP